MNGVGPWQLHFALVAASEHSKDRHIENIVVVYPQHYQGTDDENFSGKDFLDIALNGGSGKICLVKD